MKRAVNIRLEESVILTLNHLTQELQATKTEIIEKAITLFSKENNHQRHQLLEFAGTLKGSDADQMLTHIKEDKVNKEFTLELE
jgi:predicted transcriptional regulator